MRDIAAPRAIASIAIARMRKSARPLRSLARPHLVLLMLLAGCTVGPDFHVPRPPSVEDLTPRPLPDRVVADGKVQRLERSGDLPGEWWTLFRSADLTALVELALRNNHDLRAAQAALRVAQANYAAQQGALFPVIGVSETSSRQKVATADLSSPTISGDPYFTLHTAQLTVSYVPDVFGGIRRQVEAASAQAESQSFALEATHLTLTSNIALAAIAEASLRAQIQETNDAVDAERMLAEGEKINRHGQVLTSASARDWAALRAALAQTEQTIPLLKKQLIAQRDLLSALTGQFPGNGLREHFALASLQLPRDMPVMLPSDIVAQRPDVRAARANLHAAGALVGVAIANRIPLFNITGNIGRTSSQFENLANPAPQFLFWTLAGSVSQTIFDGFTLEQRQRAAEAGLTQAMEQYQSTVVTAFQNVADVLQAFELDGRSVNSADAAATAARENLCLTVAGFAGYDGRTKPENADLKYVNTDDEGLKQTIRGLFAGWWHKVCNDNIRKKLSGATAAAGDSTDASADKAKPCSCDSPPSGIDVVTSEQLYLATRLSLVTARATRYTDAVALFQALGGGWWHRADIDPPAEPGLLAGARSASDSD